MNDKRFTARGEIRALFTLCHDGSDSGAECANMLLASLNKQHFATPIGQKVYRRIMWILKHHSELPDIEDLFDEPGIEQEMRDSLRDAYDEGMRGLKRVDATRKLFRRLDDYRKIRALWVMGHDLEKALTDDEVRPDDIIGALSTHLTNAAASARRMRVYSRGDGNTTLDLAKKVLSSSGPQFIPTGFRAYDSVNSGIPKPTFMVLAAVTGGGKSTMSSQIAENMAMAGARVGIVPLEMTAEEMVMRDMARAAEYDLTNLINPKEKMSTQARKDVYRAYREETIKIDRRGGCVKLIEPGGDVDIQTLLAEVQPFGFDVVIIDYIGLLKGAESDQMWQELGKIARYCKVWSGITGTTVIMNAQLADTGAVRYAGAITEHAAYAWFWTLDKWAEENGIITIRPRKGRMSRRFDFPLKIDFATMHIRDCTREEKADWQEYEASLVQDDDGRRRPQRKRSEGKSGSGKGDDDGMRGKEKKRMQKDGGHGGGKWSPNYSGGKGKKRDFVEEEF